MMSEFDTEPLLYRDDFDGEADFQVAQPHKSDLLGQQKSPQQGSGSFDSEGEYQLKTPPPGYEAVQQPPKGEIPGPPTGEQWRPIKVTTFAEDVEQQSEFVARESFTGQIVTSYFTTWLCCWMCGLVAFIFALGAANHSKTGSALKAKRLGKLSYGFSIAGIVSGVLFTIAIIVIYVVLMKPLYDQFAAHSKFEAEQFRG